MLLLTVLVCLAVVTADSTVSAEFAGKCIDNPQVVNKTDVVKAHIISTNGVCEPYRGLAPICNPLIETDLDYVYIPNSRLGGDQYRLSYQANFTSLILNDIPEQCRETARKILCAYYFIPCGRNGSIVLPQSICRDECEYLSIDLCPGTWKLAVQYFETHQDREFFIKEGLTLPNCSNPGEILEPLPYCCSSVITIPNATEPANNPTNTTDPSGSGRSNSTALLTIIIASAAGGGGLIILIALILILCLCWFCHCHHNTHPESSIFTLVYKGEEPRVIVEDASGGRYGRGPQVTGGETSGLLNNGVTLRPLSQHNKVRVPSALLRQMSGGHLIPHEQLELLDCIGEGEFGVVYRAKWTCQRGEMPKIVAVKTLKALFNERDMKSFMEEILMMKNFHHPNVLNLIGVCVDSNSAPLLVVPFMANGSLLRYLKRERPRLTIAEQCDKDLIDETQRKLLSMCLQIAKGMEYLAEQRFVHRDLAARNCMIDKHGLIKVADFGLSEDIYGRNYFRQGKEENDVKLPVKWMALESLQDSIFTEKTDVWSFGVTCWEIFSLGRVPYPGVAPAALLKHLEQGNRLEKPSNAACSEEIFSILLRCWEECVDKRPNFSELIHDITTILETVAGYIDLNFMSTETDTENVRPGYDYLEELDTQLMTNGTLEDKMEEEATSKSSREEEEKEKEED